MGKTYSKDLREKVVDFIERGGGKSEAARVFKIGRDTFYRWLRLSKSGSLSPKKRTSFYQKVNVEELKVYVAAHPDHTLKEIGKALNLGYQTVAPWLHRLKITRKKKTTRYRERDEEKRAAFRDHLKTLDPAKVVFIDEAGVDNLMDNAAFHKSPKTRSLIEEARCHLLFLPTYSPDMNPIEHCWHQIKSILRPLVQNGYENFQKLIGDTVLNI